MRWRRGSWSKRMVLSLVLGASLAVGIGSAGQAQSPDSAPAELKNLLQGIEAAANRQDLATVMNFYSPNFVTSDDMGREAFSQGLSRLWERFKQVRYSTQLQSWQQEGEMWVAETLTQVTGTQPLDGREVKMQSQVRSRQYFQNQQMVRQEILSEQTQMSVGDNPPEVDVQLPEQVKPGEAFNFDVIVAEPLGNELLLGAALEEPITSEQYLNPGTFDLELLQAGGIFKTGRAPTEEKDHWLSAILIRSDGMTIVTRRLRINP